MEKFFLFLIKCEKALALEGPPGTKFEQVGTIKTWGGTIANFVFGAAGAVFVVMFIAGGIQYLTTMGNEEASTKAKKLLTDAVIGIVIVVTAWAIANYILTGIGGEANFGS
jgi:hypothetical protein